MKGSDLVDFKQACRASGTAAKTLRQWLSEDGAILRRRRHGLFLHWNDLRKCLAKRGRPIPPSLDRGARLLLVDDDPQTLLKLVDGLSEALDRPQIATAEDGRCALRKLRRLRPDLLVTDLEMPAMGGLELCRLVRQDPRFDRMKILALTGFDSSPSRWERGSDGADGHLAKPFSFAELRKKVTRLLGGPMKKTTIAVLLLVAACGISRAQQGNLGAGLILGNPIGVTAKYFATNTSAVDAGIGSADDGNFTVYADYLWHAWDIFPKPKEGRLGAYLGLGGQLRDADQDNIFGLRTVGGISYWLQGHPVETFAELVPVFEVSPSAFVQLDGGVGVRYYFGPVASAGAPASKK